jgi:nucleotide-binding universal stress UspA family protein
VLSAAPVRAAGRPTPPQPWVVLEHWHILRQPTPRILACDSGEGPSPALQIARPLVDALDGVATVVGVAGSSAEQDALRESLARRAAEAGLEGAAIRARTGDPAEQIALEQSEAPYDFLLLGEARSPVRGGWRRTSGGLAEEVFSSVSTPTIVVRGAAAPPRKILICTAVGEPGKADVRAGGWLARRLGGTVTLLHVATGDRASLPIAKAHLERGVATLRELEVSGRYTIREADSAIEGILAELESDPHDLVVVGGPAPGVRAPLLRGDSITRQALRQCPCSVMVVPDGSW